MGLLSIGSFFVTEFFDRPLPAFANLSNSFTAWDVNRALGLFLLVLVLATGFLAYRRSGPERLARELFSREVFSPENAVSLSELPIKVSLALRFSLHDRWSSLRRCVLIVGEPPLESKKPTKEEKKAAKEAARANREKNPFVSLKKRFFPDLSDAKFYLAKERREEIERRYMQEKGVTLKTFLWTLGVSVALFFVLCRLMPEILLLIDRILG
ncbi:MAG: hypothetical protein IKP55_00910 [Clostridia bacterium]|nr:hypothetical protein [Clostridia bacterium]